MNERKEQEEPQDWFMRYCALRSEFGDATANEAIAEERGYLIPDEEKSSRKMAALDEHVRARYMALTKGEWQKCPICDGRGTENVYGTTELRPCGVCQGYRVVVAPVVAGAGQ